MYFISIETVEIITPEADATSALVELPNEVTDNSERIIVGCGAARGNSFAVTGRGGLSEDPTATIRGQTVWLDLQDWSVAAEDSRGNVSLSPTTSEPPAKAVSEIVQAAGWIVNEEGKVELVAQFRDGGESNVIKSPECRDLSYAQ